MKLVGGSERDEAEEGEEAEEGGGGGRHDRRWFDFVRAWKEDRRECFCHGFNILSYFMPRVYFS